MSSKDLENVAQAARPAGDRILVQLKTRGPQTAGALGRALGITGEAARQQLLRLASSGLVSASAEPRGVGRPAQQWALTAAANARFPDAHAELTAQLIQSIRTQLGEEALDRLIDARAAGAQATYAAALEGAADLGEKVARLAEARAREGYMAESKPQGAGFLLIENHCPICVAASACQGFCRAELATFRAVLGKEVTVDRDEYLIDGARRCTYRISLNCIPEAAPKRRKKKR